MTFEGSLKFWKTEKFENFDQVEFSTTLKLNVDWAHNLKMVRQFDKFRNEALK